MISIRKATREDAEFIARMVMMALHMDGNSDIAARMGHVSQLDDTIYSWRNCVIAEWDGRNAGICLAYDGAGYHGMRMRTFSLFGNNEDIMNQADETEEGEFYVDSLAVLPEFRGRGIAVELLKDAILRAKELKLTPSLLVLPVNPPAQKLYARMGFRYSSEQFAFGEIYQKWKIREDKQ